jgi:hypothetical protein
MKMHNQEQIVNQLASASENPSENSIKAAAVSNEGVTSETPIEQEPKKESGFLITLLKKLRDFILGPKIDNKTYDLPKESKSSEVRIEIQLNQNQQQSTIQSFQQIILMKELLNKTIEKIARQEEVTQGKRPSPSPHVIAIKAVNYVPRRTNSFQPTYNQQEGMQQASAQQEGVVISNPEIQQEGVDDRQPGAAITIDVSPSAPVRLTSPAISEQQIMEGANQQEGVDDHQPGAAINTNVPPSAPVRLTSPTVSVQQTLEETNKTWVAKTLQSSASTAAKAR